MTDEERKAKNREYSRRYAERYPERRKESYARYRENHRDEIKARARKHRADNLEAVRKYQREWKQKWREGHRKEDSANTRRWLKNHPEYYAKKYAANRDWIMLKNSIDYIAMRERFKTDAKAWAEWRRKIRENYAKNPNRRKPGKMYMPRPHRRFPDWACLGEDLIRRGNYIVNALGKDVEMEYRGYRNELIKERYGDK